MNLARLFMLGNLSAENPFPPRLPEWLERLPKEQRKAALERFLREPAKAPRSEREKLEEEVKNTIEAFELLSKFKEERIQEYHPESVEERVKDSLNTFRDHAKAAFKLIAQSNVQSAKASNLPEIEEANQMLSQAKDFIDKAVVLKDRAVALKDLSKTFFDKGTQANQEEIINRLSEDLEKAKKPIIEKKFKYTFEPMESAHEAILRLSKKIVSGEADPNSINALEAGIRGIQRFASMFSAMPNISDQERSKAKEALLLSESMRTLLRTYKEEFVEEAKVHSPQLSFPEKVRQRKNFEFLSKAVDFIKAAFSKPHNQKEQNASLDAFSRTAEAFGASVRIDPSLIPLLEETISRARTFIAPLSWAHPSVIVPDERMGIKRQFKSSSERKAYERIQNEIKIRFENYLETETYKSIERSVKRWLKSKGTWPKGEYDNSEKIDRIHKMAFLSQNEKSDMIHDLLENEENKEGYETPEVQMARKATLEKWTIKFLIPMKIAETAEAAEAAETAETDDLQRKAFTSLMALQTFIRLTKEGRIPARSF